MSFDKKVILYAASLPLFLKSVTRNTEKTMTKAKYMALADFQTLWSNSIKPAIPSIAGTANFASDSLCEDAADEIVFTPAASEE